MSIPYGQHWIDEGDVAAVSGVLRSARLTQGPEVERFEAALVRWCGARHAVAVSSGTAALHVACMALGLRGDPDRRGPPRTREVVTTPITFLASASCIAYCGGLPSFVDIDPRSYHLTSRNLAQHLGTHPHPEHVRGVIPVHFAGQPCDIESIHELARARGLFVLEDASHALGARWRDRAGAWHRVGGCSASDAAVFSFHPVKHITCAEGGAILTNSAEIAERCRRLREHGIVRGTSSEEPWVYEMRELGFNYRLPDLQCVLGLSQLERAEAWLERRRWIARAYDEAFKDLPEIVTPWVSPGVEHSYHLYVVQVPDRRAVFHALRERGIGVQVHYVPVHTQPYYRERFGYGFGDFPVAEAYYERALSLPVFPAMSEDDVECVIDAVRGAVREVLR